MAESISVAGLGELTSEPGPGQLIVWRLQRHVASSAYDNPIAVTVLLDGEDDLDDVDWSVVLDVLSDIDRYLTVGLRFVHTAILTDPALFGWAKDDHDSYRDVPAEQLPLDDPQLIFYTGGAWLLHFQSGRMPVCDPYGLGVMFDRGQPTRLEDLSDAEQID